MSGTIPISVVTIAYNEARNLPAFLRSVADWADEVFVVDSGSTDGTTPIAEAAGAHVVQHEFEGYSKQWNWALRNLPLRHDWALCLDADHRVTPELREELAYLFGEAGGRAPVRAASEMEGIDGFYVKRRQIFRGRWVRFGGYYPKYLLKLIRHGNAWADERELADHHFYVDGKTARLRGDIVEDNRNEADLGVWIGKHVVYARRQALEELRRDRGEMGWSVEPALFGSPDQRTVWLKRIWYRLPLYVRPLLYFSYRYFLRLGFLDGRTGFAFHFLQGFWYRLVVDVMLDDLRRGVGREDDRVAAAATGVSDERSAGSVLET